VFWSSLVAALVKHRLAERRDAPLHYWRDDTGREIDLLIDAGNRLILIKVKSGRTQVAGRRLRHDQLMDVAAGQSQSGRRAHLWRRARLRFQGRSRPALVSWNLN